MHPPPLTSWLALYVCFLGGFPGPQYVGGFLSCSSGLPVRRSSACVSLELFSRPLVLSAAVVPCSLIPLRCLTFRRLVSVPVFPRDSCGLVGCVLRTLRWCSAVSLLFVGLLLVMVRPVLFLFSVSSVRSWGRCSPRFPPFSPSGLLSARSFVLSPCPLGFSFLLVVCSCLLSPVGRLVSSRVSAALASLRGQGRSSPGCPCSVPSVCLCLAPFLPSSPAPPVSCSLVVFLSLGQAPPLRASWLTHPAMVSLGLCALLSVSSLAHPSGVVVLFYSSVFV